jgi:hypothetical protein
MGDIEREVEFGLEQFSPERKVEVALRDILFAYKAIGEFIHFFHDPDHFTTLTDVNRFLGNTHEGALHVLCEAYYQRLRNVWPPDVQKAFDDGLLDTGCASSAETNAKQTKDQALEAFTLPDDDVSCWLEQESSVMLKAVTKHGDPVELTREEAVGLAHALLKAAEKID